MSKLFSKVRGDKEKQQVEETPNNNIPQQDFESLNSQMDALALQDYQNMALEQFEKLVIVGMCYITQSYKQQSPLHAIAHINAHSLTVAGKLHINAYNIGRYWYLWESISRST
jgi:hypothetical protein